MHPRHERCCFNNGHPILRGEVILVVLSKTLGILLNMEQAEFQQKQSEIYTDLASAVIDSIPDDWDTAVLTLGSPAVEGGMESMSHELANPKLTEGMVTVMPDDSIYSHTRRLEMLFCEFGARWKQATFQVTWDYADDQWRMLMEYEYDE